MLEATVRWGKEPGVILRPHKYRIGKFKTEKFKGEDWKWASTESELRTYPQRGWSIRMSNPDGIHHRGPSLIVPGYIRP